MSSSVTPSRRVSYAPRTLPGNPTISHDPPIDHTDRSPAEWNASAALPQPERERSESLLEKASVPLVIVLAMVLLNALVIYLCVLMLAWQGAKLVLTRDRMLRRERTSNLVIPSLTLAVAILMIPLAWSLTGGIGVSFGTGIEGWSLAIATLWGGATIQLGKLGAIVLLGDAARRLLQRPIQWSWTPLRVTVELLITSVVVFVGLLGLIAMAVSTEHAFGYALSIFFE